MMCARIPFCFSSAVPRVIVSMWPSKSGERWRLGGELGGNGAACASRAALSCGRGAVLGAPALERAARPAQLRGGLGLTEPFQKTEDERLFLRRGQSVQLLIQGVQEFAPGQIGRRRQPWVWQFLLTPAVPIVIELHFLGHPV